MTVLDEILRLFRYEAWANRGVLESLRQLEDPSRATTLFAHILAAQQVWLARIRGEDVTRFDVWPGATLKECQRWLDEMAAALDEYLAGLTDAELRRGVTYRPTFRNADQREFRNTPLEILQHVALHSHYHRGQIAAHIRDAGGEPATTDFMIYLRESQG